MIATNNYPMEPWLVVSDEIVLRSRLLIGFEQYRSPSIIKAVLEASGVELIILTINPWQQDEQSPSVDLASLSSVVDLSKYIIVGTTSSATSAKQAIELGLVLCELLKTRIVKLDVRFPIGQRIYPDNEQVVQAAKELVNQGCVVLPMINPDLTTALRLRDLGCAALRVLAGVIGSRSGITNQHLLKMIAGAVEIPVIAEGGISKPSDVAIAMESGAKAVLVNTAIAQSNDPVKMARAMRLVVDAAYLYQGAQ